MEQTTQREEQDAPCIAKLHTLCVFTVWVMKGKATNQMAEVSLGALT